MVEIPTLSILITGMWTGSFPPERTWLWCSSGTGTKRSARKLAGVIINTASSGVFHRTLILWLTNLRRQDNRLVMFRPFGIIFIQFWCDPTVLRTLLWMVCRKCRNLTLRCRHWGKDGGWLCRQNIWDYRSVNRWNLYLLNVGISTIVSWRISIH